MDTQLLAAPACLQEAVIAFAGLAGTVVAPPPARYVATLVINGQTLSRSRRKPVLTPSKMTPGQLPAAPAQLLLVNRRHRYESANDAALTRLPAGLALGNLESILRTQTGLRLRSGLKSFTRLISTAPPGLRLGHALSSYTSARRRLRRIFSFSSFLRRLASFTFNPSLQLLQR